MEFISWNVVGRENKVNDVHRPYQKNLHELKVLRWAKKGNGHGKNTKQIKWRPFKHTEGLWTMLYKGFQQFSQ